MRAVVHTWVLLFAQSERMSGYDLLNPPAKASELSPWENREMIPPPATLGRLAGWRRCQRSKNRKAASQGEHGPSVPTGARETRPRSVNGIRLGALPMVHPGGYCGVTGGRPDFPLKQVCDIAGRSGSSAANVASDFAHGT